MSEYVLVVVVVLWNLSAQRDELGPFSSLEECQRVSQAEADVSEFFFQDCGVLVMCRERQRR